VVSLGFIDKNIWSSEYCGGNSLSGMLKFVPGIDHPKLHIDFTASAAASFLAAGRVSRAR